MTPHARDDRPDPSPKPAGVNQERQAEGDPANHLGDERSALPLGVGEPGFPGSRWKPRVSPLWLLVIGLSLVGMALAKPVVLIVLWAVLLAMLLAPFDRVMHRALPERIAWARHLVMVLVILLGGALFAGAIAGGVFMAAERFSESEQSFNELQEQLDGYAQRIGLESFSPAEGESLLTAAVSYARSLAAGAVAIVAGFVVVLFLTLLAHGEMPDGRGRLQRAFGSHGAERVIHTLSRIASEIRAYFIVRTVVSLISGVATALLLLALGIDLWWAFGLLVFVLNYVPNLGSIISSIPPIVYALTQHGWTKALLVAGGILLIEQTIGNFIDPKLMGRYLNLSPFAVLTAVLLFTLVLGVSGALLAVLVLIGLLVACEQSPKLRPWASILSRRGDAPLDTV